MRQRRPATLARLLLIPVLVLAASTGQQQVRGGPVQPDELQAEGRKPYRALRASKLIGRKVANAEGQGLGRVEDLIVDMNTGAVRYAMLAFDPGLMHGKKLFAVPTRELRLPEGAGHLVYDTPPEQLERAGIERSRWISGRGDSAAYPAGLDTAYGIVQPSGDQRAYRASALIGKPVKSAQGDGIGAIEDLVVDMGAQKIHYAVLSFDPSWISTEKLYAFPLRSFGFADGGDGLVLQVDQTKLQAMKSFDRDRWANLTDRVFVADIDRYLATVTPAVAATAPPAAVFGRLDSDQDGFLSRREAERNRGVHAAWAKLDRDRNGRLSRTEVTTGYQVDAGAAPGD